MAKKESPAAPEAPPAEVPRVTYVTTEGVTTVLNPKPADAKAIVVPPVPPTEEIE